MKLPKNMIEIHPLFNNKDLSNFDSWFEYNNLKFLYNNVVYKGKKFSQLFYFPVENSNENKIICVV
jgi:hypothetical protein